jgi:hypothetical protein
MSSQKDVYSYSPLSDRGNIRLLRLMASEDGDIRVHIFQYPLQASDRQEIHLYEALSYVWGSELSQKPIYVRSDNDNVSRCFPVTASLYAALLHLRDRFLPRILWVDAVCINQQDNDEKGFQVQRMAKIYASASRVVVWLGDPGNAGGAGGDEALQILRRLGEEQSASSSDAVSDRVTQPSVDMADRQAVHALFERPWFQRMWVRHSALSTVGLP